MKARQRWLLLHRHLGLWAGGLFVLLGLTGSILAFYPEVDAALNPAIRPASVPPAPVSVQRTYKVLRDAFPQRTGPWRIELPLAADSPITARYYTPVEKADKRFAPLMVTIDPASYRITSTRFWGDYAATWIYDLHYTLLAEELGHNLVGLCGIVLLLSVVLGCWLWLPRPGRILSAMKPALRPQPVKKIYDLHVLTGVYAAVVLGVIALTGVVLAYPNASKGLAAQFLDFGEPMPRPRQVIHDLREQADLDRLLERAKAELPLAETRWVETSGADGREVTFRLFSPGEPGRRFPQTYLKLHPASGAVLYRREYQQLPGGDRLWAWVHPLHNGEAFGLAGRLLLVFLGLTPAMLWVTGMIRYGHKRKVRQL